MSTAAADSLCQMRDVYLGHPWLHPPCCQAQCQSRSQGRCYGRDSEGLRREVRDAGLDKGLTKVLYLLTGIPASGFVSLPQSDFWTLYGLINVKVLESSTFNNTTLKNVVTRKLAETPEVKSQT